MPADLRASIQTFAITYGRSGAKREGDAFSRQAVDTHVRHRAKLQRIKEKLEEYRGYKMTDGRFSAVDSIIKYGY